MCTLILKRCLYSVGELFAHIKQQPQLHIKLLLVLSSILLLQKKSCRVAKEGVKLAQLWAMPMIPILV